MLKEFGGPRESKNIFTQAGHPSGHYDIIDPIGLDYMGSFVYPGKHYLH